jgi:hypothetical protein
MMTRQQILDWLKQPTTQIGVFLEVALVGVHASGFAQHIAAGTLETYLYWLNLGAAAFLWPDNTTDQIKTQDVMARVIAAGEARQQTATLEPKS